MFASEHDSLYDEAESTRRLLTAVAALREALETLPEPSAKEYPAALTHAVTAPVAALHAAYDAWAASVLITEKRRITCSRGCSACCRHFVSSVEPYELIALDARLKARADYADLVLASHSRAVLYANLTNEELARGATDEEAGDRALYRYFQRGKPCPFLAADGACGVYDVRPMACRMFYAESPPRYCAGKELASPWNRNFQLELPQEVEEALARCARLLDHLEFSEDLFPGVVAVNEAFGRYDLPDASDSGSTPDNGGGTPKATD